MSVFLPTTSSLTSWVRTPSAMRTRWTWRSRSTRLSSSSLAQTHAANVRLGARGGGICTSRGGGCKRFVCVGGRGGSSREAVCCTRPQSVAQSACKAAAWEVKVYKAVGHTHAACACIAGRVAATRASMRPTCCVALLPIPPSAVWHACRLNRIPTLFASCQPRPCLNTVAFPPPLVPTCRQGCS